MSLEATRSDGVSSPFEQILQGRDILLQESRALERIAERLDRRFCQAIDRLYRCTGSVIVSGMGKAGLIGQKIAATLASTGTRSHFLHPAEAVHGDLGRVDARDLILMLSQSGETEEVVRLLPSFATMGVPLLAVTGRAESTLGRAATVVLPLGDVGEACSLGLAPSSSTTAMLALGDALALVVSRMRGFGRDDFARYHPGGSLGLRLSQVDQTMRPLERCRLARDTCSVREVFVDGSLPGRRTGAIMLIDAEGRLSGIFTDSDLAKVFEHRQESALDSPIGEVMTADPMTVQQGLPLTDAVAILADRKISELPVVDADGRPVGLIDVTDVLGLLPESAEAPSRDAMRARLRVISDEPTSRDSA